MGTIIIVVIIAVIVTLFSVQNAMPVSISFLAWQFDMLDPQWQLAASTSGEPGALPRPTARLRNQRS